MPAFNFQPLGARCLVQPTEVPKLSDSIIIPDSAKQKSDEGIIVAMGTEPFGHGKVVQKDPNTGILIQLKVGDKVLFQKYTGSEFKIAGIDCRIFNYDDLLGIMHQTLASASPEPSRILRVAPGTIQTGLES